MEHRCRLFMVLALGSLALATISGGCGDGDADADSDGDSDGDGDSDADGDSDTDVDVDVDGDGDGDADGDADGDTDIDGDGDADGDTDIDGDGDADGDADGDVDAETDAEVDDDEPLDPACFDGHDPSNPDHILRALVPTAPPPLASESVIAAMQRSLDDGSTIYLMQYEDITGDGECNARVGIGEAVIGTTGRYRFAAPPAAARVAISGNDFTTAPGTVDLVMRIATALLTVDVPVREATVSGTFTTSDRCSVGSQDSTSGAWTTGGIISGVIPVDEASGISLPLGITLCDLLAGGACRGEPETWINPPDGRTSDGDPAWNVSADFASTAVVIEP